MALPLFTTSIKELSLLQTQWKSQIDPLLADPVNSNIVLKNISLVTGTNAVNHMLGRKLQGWKIVRQRAAASIYDNQDNNQNPASTLILISSAPVVVDLEVF